MVTPTTKHFSFLGKSEDWPRFCVYLDHSKLGAMNWKKVLLIGIVLAMLGGAYGLYLFFKPVPSVASMKTDEQITSMALAGAFEQDETQAGEQYLGKVLEVTGVVTEVIPGDSADVTIVLGSDGFIQVLAGMEKTLVNENELVENEITVKGICTGSTMLDVVLSRCVFIEP